MAKRRALARALAGLGQGMANASQQWMSQLQREKLQDRYDQRAAESAKASAARADEAEVDRVSREIRMKVAAGEIEPAAASVMLSQLAPTRPIGAADLEPIRPSLSKRIGKKFDPMMGSQFPEGLPTDEELATFVKGEGGMVPGALDMPMSADTPSGFDPFSMLRPEAGAVAHDFSNSVGARRRSLMSRPTEVIKGEDPITGADTVRTMSPYSPDLQSGMTIGPTAEQAGALEGQKRSTFLDVAGDAEAAQAGNVAGATEDARNTAPRQQARTSEAVNREIQILKGSLPYKLDFARKSAAIEIQQAVDKGNAINTTESIKASGALMGPQFFDRVVDITRALNDQDGVDARLKGAGKTVAYYLGGAPELKELEQLVAQNKRLLAQAFGVKEGNPSDKDMENVRNAIGIDQWSTATERLRGLRNLQDMISIGPTVAVRLPANADMATRMELAKSLATARRKAEDEAAAAGATEYNDPVTHSRIKVIQ